MNEVDDVIRNYGAKTENRRAVSYTEVTWERNILWMITDL